MAAILNSVVLNSTILDSAILVFPLKHTHTCQDWFSTICTKKLHSHFPPQYLHKKTSLIHSDSTWWWWPSWILPSWILPSWIQLLHYGIKTPCFLLADSLKNISLYSDSDSNYFNLTQTHSFSLNLMMTAILNSPNLVSAILHKKHHSFILT